MPANDPRMKFPNEITDAFGCGDKEQLRKFMRENCASDMVFYMQYDGKQNPYGPNTRLIRGVESFVDFCIAVFETLPDFVATFYQDHEIYYDPKTNETYGCYRTISTMTKIALVVDTPTSSQPALSSIISEGNCQSYVFSVCYYFV